MKLGFFGALALVFITLKLTGVIAWSWVWVLSPLWLGFAIVFGFAGLLFVACIIHAVIVDVRKKRK